MLPLHYGVNRHAAACRGGVYALRADRRNLRTGESAQRFTELFPGGDLPTDTRVQTPWTGCRSSHSWTPHASRRPDHCHAAALLGPLSHPSALVVVEHLALPTLIAVVLIGAGLAPAHSVCTLFSVGKSLPSPTHKQRLLNRLDHSHPAASGWLRLLEFMIPGSKLQNLPDNLDLPCEH